MKKVCCVVPIYNVREYLSDCLDSLANQTIGSDNLQVVMVDDGSTDGSSKIADEYAASYDNFEVHHIENGGLGHARNYGAQFADAEWICFADSDDIIVDTAYEEMYNLGRKYDDVDMVLGDVIRFNSKKTFASKCHRLAFKNASEVMHITTHPNLINDTTSWNKLYLKSFYDKNHIFWPEGIIYEDIPVTIPAHYLARKVAYLDKVVYKWRSRDNATSSLTQQRTNHRNFTDRLAVMSMVDEFFSKNIDDEEQHVIKDAHWLAVDLLIFIGQFENGDEKYQNLVFDLISERIKQFDKRAFLRIHAIDRMKYDRIAAHDKQGLIDTLHFQRRGMKTLSVRQYADGSWHGNYPFDWVTDSLSDMTWELHEYGIKQKIRTVEFDDRERSLHVGGTAYAMRINETNIDSIDFSAYLVNDELHPVCDINMIPQVSQHKVHVNISRDYKRIVPRVRCHREYDIEIPYDLLKGLPDGKYRICYEYSNGALKCNERLLCSPVKGIGPRPFAIIDGDKSYSISYNPSYELVITVETVKELVTGITVSDGTVCVMCSDGSNTEIDINDVIHGRWVRVNEMFFDPKISFIRTDEGLLSFRAGRDGYLSIQHLAPGVTGDIMRFDDEGFDINIDMSLADGFTGDARVTSVLFHGRRYGVDIDMPISVRDGNNVVCGIAFNDKSIIESCRADTYEIRVEYTDCDGECRVLPVYSSSDKSEQATEPVYNSGYKYKLDESWSKILVKSWDVPQSWWDKSKRRKRLAEVLLYPIFRMLPIKKKTVMFESFWGRSTDCNPYAFYEWMDKNHPEYECVWSVNDVRMRLDGNGKKVKRGSLAYMMEMARAKFFLNNVNFMDNHVKRPHQIEIQTMHGTPLKTLGLDVPGDFPTQASIDKFLRKCNRWDYLIVQGKKTEEITKSCYRFDRTFLETGYPRNDELFNGNTPENISSIKQELGLDPSKKLVLYAPTWRISNRFDLMLDLGKMCDVLGNEYQVALRVHHLAAAGLHESELDPRVINLTNAPSISDLYLITDVLITDYSSVMFDYACVKKLDSDERKPMIFFPYDLEDYRDNLRGFNIDLETEAPGPVLLTSDEVIDAVKNIDRTEDEYREKYDEFIKKFIEFEHGNASAEVFEQVFINPIK